MNTISNLPNEHESHVSSSIESEDPLLDSESHNLRSRIIPKPVGDVTCNGATKSKSQSLEEISNKNLSRVYFCSLCNYETANRSTFKSHNIVRHNNEVYICYHCSFKTKYRDYLKDHLRIHYGENGKCYQCDMCTFKTAIRTNLARHKITHSDNKRHLCHICPYSTNEMDTLKSHIKKVHNHGVYLECNMCDYKTLFKYDFIQHEKSHDSKYIFKCPTCVYIGPTKDCLKTHMRAHRTNLIECYDCGFKTHLKPTLINHIKIHRNEKPYKCIDCSYTARTITPFKAHLNKYKHSDAAKIEIFRCDVCDYETLTRKVLIWHQKVHSSKKLFECYICEYKTDSSSNFKKHEYIHEKNKRKN